MFYENLCKVQEKHQLVSLYLERNPETFIVGFIEQITEKELIFVDLSLIGKKERTMLIPMTQIIRYVTDGLYEKKMLALFKFHEEKQKK